MERAPSDVLSLDLDVELVSPLDGGLVADLVLALSSSLYAAACSGTCYLGHKFTLKRLDRLLTGIAPKLTACRVAVDVFPTTAISSPLFTM